MSPRVARVQRRVRVFGCVFAADERLGEPMRVACVVEAEAAFHAQARIVGRPILATNGDDAVRCAQRVGLVEGFDLEIELTADAAIGADAGDLSHFRLAVHAPLVQAGGFHQRTRWAGLDALPTADAGRHAHGIIEIIDYLRLRASEGHADDVIDLNFAARPNAEIALNAGVQIH